MQHSWISREGDSSDFDQNPYGGQSFMDKIFRGVPYFAFYYIFKTVFFNYPLPPLTLCALMNFLEKTNLHFPNLYPSLTYPTYTT